MNEAEKNFLEEIDEAVQAADAERLSDAVSDFSSFCFMAAETPPFSNEFIERLIQLMQGPAFLESPDAYKLLLLFQNDWGRLSTEQRLRVCQFLETIYEQIKDHTAQLVIVELLGRFLANSHGLEALDKLSSAKDEVARAHVAHGYKCLVLSNADTALRQQAKARLTNMASDPSDVVKAEVKSALADLAK